MHLYGHHRYDYVDEFSGKRQQGVRSTAMLVEQLHGFIKQHYPNKLSIVSGKFKSSLQEGGHLQTIPAANRYTYDGAYVTCQFAGVHSQCGMIIFEKWNGTIYDGHEDLFTAHIAAAESIAKECLGYSAAMVTLIDEQKIKQLIKNGYKTIDIFPNSRSGNKVSILMKHL